LEARVGIGRLKRRFHPQNVTNCLEIKLTVGGGSDMMFGRRFENVGWF
jgi:hypothetical protein